MAGSSGENGNLEQWSLSDTERAINLEISPATKTHTESAIWKLYVPKLMPLIPQGTPKETPCTLADSMFINDPACRPVVQQRIMSRNWLNASRPANASFQYPYKYHGMALEVEVLNRNPNNLRITNTTDNSIP